MRGLKAAAWAKAKAHHGTSSAPAAPNRQLPWYAKLVVWGVAVIALLGIAMVAQQGTASTQPVGNAAVSSITQDAFHAQTASSSSTPQAADNPSVCIDSSSAQGTIQSQLLPAMRWSDTPLISADNGDSVIDKLKNAATMIANLLFSLASLAWTAFFAILSWGLLFQPLCSVASSVNTLSIAVGTLAAYLLIPALTVILWTKRKPLMQGGAGKFFTAFALLVVMFGGVFFFVDKATSVKGASNEVVMNTTGTLPWFAGQVIKTFSSASTSLNVLSDNATTQVQTNPMSAFSDTKNNIESSKTNKNTATCSAYDSYLYYQYAHPTNSGGGLATASGGALTAMEQMSRIWEVTYLKSWMGAQYGSGGAGNTLPSTVACSHLERGNAAGQTKQQRAETYLAAYRDSPEAAKVLPANVSAQSIEDSGWIYMIYPGMNDDLLRNADVIMAYCGDFLQDGYKAATDMDKTAVYSQLACVRPDAPFGANGLTHKYENSRDAMTTLLQGGSKKSSSVGVTVAGFRVNLAEWGGKTGVYSFDEGAGDVDKKLAKNNSSVETDALNYQREWAKNFLGQNDTTRIMQSVLAVIVSLVYVWSMGPVAAGLPIAGLVLIIGLPFIPLALALISMSIPMGKRILKMTFMSAAATFLFGIMLGFLAAINSLLSTTVVSLLGGSQGGLWGQIILALVPLAALWLLKKTASSVGLGELTSPLKGLGMATGMAAAAAGEGAAYRRAHEGMTRPLRRGSSLLGNAAAGYVGARVANRGRKSEGADKEKKSSLMDRLMQSKPAKAMANSSLGQAVSGVTQGTRDKTARHLNAGKAKVAAGARRVGSAIKTNPKVKQFLESPAGKALTSKKAGTVAKSVGATLGLGALAGGFPAGLSLMAVGAGASLLGGKWVGDKSALQRMAGWGDKQRSLLSAQKVRHTVRQMNEVELQQLDPTYTRGQLNPPKLTTGKEAQDITSAAKQLEMQLSQVADPATRRALIDSIGAASVSNSLARLHGGKSDNKLNQDFSGMLSEVAKADVKNGLKAHYGVADWDVSDAGFVTPTAVARTKQGLPKLPPGTPLEALDLPDWYVPKHIAQENPNDMPGDRANRIAAFKTAAGLYDPTTNRNVSMLDRMGLDINNEQHRSMLQNAMDGVAPLPTTYMDKIQLSSTREQAAQIKAFERAADNLASQVRQQRQEQMEEIGKQVERAREVVSAPSDIVVGKLENKLPSGKVESQPITLGDAHSDLGATSLQLNELLSQLQSPNADRNHAVSVRTIRGLLDSLRHQTSDIQNGLADLGTSADLGREMASMSSPDNDVDLSDVLNSVNMRNEQLNELTESRAQALADLENLISSYSSAGQQNGSHTLSRMQEVVAGLKDRMEASYQQYTDEAGQVANQLDELEISQRNELESAQRSTARTGTGPVLADRSARNLPGRRRPGST